MDYKVEVSEKPLKNSETIVVEHEKPMGTWKTGLMIGGIVVLLVVIILPIAIKRKWFKYPFGFKNE